MREPFVQAQQIADAAAVTSVASAGYAWLDMANDVGQLIATVVAIASGLAALWWHVKKIRAASRDEDQ